MDKSGKTVFNIRKISNKFFFNKFTYNPDGTKNEATSVLHSAIWPKLVKEMHGQFKLFEINAILAATTPPVSEFDPMEIAEIVKTAQNFQLYTHKVQMTMEPDKHKVETINFSDLNGKVVWNVAKDNGTYRINKVSGQTWELVYDTKNANAFFLQLVIYLKQGGFHPSTKLSGITHKEYEKIRAAVDQFGDNYWSEYVPPVQGQSAYVEVVGKDASGVGQVLFSVGTLGNFYQINDSQNKPLETAGSLNGVIARLHERLAAIAGTHAQISPVELNEIATLAVGDGFTYHEPEGDEAYTYIKGMETIEVEQYGVVKYSKASVFGPVYWKNAKSFIEWFKNVHKSGKIPANSDQFAEHIWHVLDSGGFIDKNTSTIVPHLKINAIKALRAYIMLVTGGTCGLAKSKWAIENFKTFFDYVKMHGLPNMDHNSEDFLTQFTGGPVIQSSPKVGPDKFTNEEYQEIAGLVSKHSPTLKYQFTNAFVIWVGTYITSYKVAKEGGAYRVYTDKNGEWKLQMQANTFEELMVYLESTLEHIVKALSNSKLDQPTTMTTPSTDPDKLSAEEVAELKKLIKKFGLPVSTSYTKKLMESKASQQEAYSVTINDAVHNIQVKITRKEGKYIIAKGADDSYYSLKTFDAFYNLLSYLDYFLNSYIKEPTSSILAELTDQELNLIKDLAKQYQPKAKVRRKYLKSKDAVKVPYVAIDPLHGPAFSVAKSKLGEYKLFKVNKGSLGYWDVISVTSSWDAMYDIIAKTLQGEPTGTDIKYTQPVLGPEQIEWLETLMKTQKPTVMIKQWPSGGVGAYDPTNKVFGEDNPLFIIRFAPGSSANRILQVHTEDGGGAYDEYPFNSFDEMAAFISKNIEIVTQLLKGEIAPESKLASLVTSAGFQYKKKLEVALEPGWGSKHGTIYENGEGERLYLFDDGSSRIWHKEPSTAETYKKEFNTIAKLVTWMEEHYQGKISGEFKDMQEYLAYLDFSTDKASDKWSKVWTKKIGPEHQPSYDYVHLHVNGPSKVTPSPLTGTGAPPSSPFWFQTLSDLKTYLTEKYIKGKNGGNLALASALEKGKFKKVGDQMTEMGFKWQTNKLTVVPFPSGGIMQTAINIEPKIVFSYESTYDLAKRIEQFLADDEGHVESGWSTGDDILDEIIEEAGFIYQGAETDSDGDGHEKLMFAALDGTKLYFYIYDESSALKFPPSPVKKDTGISFTTIQDLKDYLSQGLVMKSYPTNAKKSVGAFAYHYYDDLGDNQMAYSIRLTKEDEYTMKKLGWVYMSSGQTQQTSGYFSPQGYKIVFFNKSLNANNDKPTATIYKPGIGGKEHIVFKTTDWPTPFQVVQYLIKHPIAAGPSSMAPSLTDPAANESVLKYNPDAQAIIDVELHNVAPWSSVESTHFQYNDKNDGTGEIRFVGQNILRFAIGRKTIGNDLLWYVRQKVADSPTGLYTTYTFVNKDAMVKWVKEHITELVSHKSLWGTPSGSKPTPGDVYSPSGAEYETHSNEANASLIWLNEHDEALLKAMGFVRTPQHNVLYTNPNGNIVKFRDTGKAQYIDYLGDPDKPENAEVIDFDDIQHALKFIVAKHASAPFSHQPYKSDDGEHIHEIPLNQHDHDIMTQLGFEWQEKGQKYMKFIGPNDKPTIQEATVEIERHEVFTAYDTGNSIWQLMDDDGEDEEEVEVEEGSIYDVLSFIWKRWHKQLSIELKGETTLPLAEPAKKTFQSLNTTKLFDPENYPPSPSGGGDWVSNGKAIKLNPQDHASVSAAGFKFLIPTQTYENSKTKDKFRVYDNGVVWYHLVGTGEGMDTSIGHFFEMLKSKYGQLESSGKSMTGEQIIQIKDKLEKLGYALHHNTASPEDLFFYKTPKDKKSSMNIEEMVVVYPNHSMEFHLLDASTKFSIGSFDFDSVTYGIQVLENSGGGGIALQLTSELESKMNAKGYIWNAKTQRYAKKKGDKDVTLTFYGDGIAWAHLMTPISGDDVDIDEEKKFDNFYNAIMWADTADFTASSATIGPTIKGKVHAPQMSFSGFDYAGWAKGTEHNPEATIQLMPDDNQTMQVMGWGSFKSSDDTYYYVRSNGDRIYFFVDGHARLIQDGKPMDFATVEIAMKLLWSMANVQTSPEPDKPKTKADIVETLSDWGFKPLSSSGDELVFIRNTPKWVYSVTWDKEKDTIEFAVAKNKMTGAMNKMLMTQHWKKPTAEAMVTLEVVFGSKIAPKTKADTVSESLSKLGFLMIGGSGPVSGGNFVFEKKTTQAKYGVIWDTVKNTLEYTVVTKGKVIGHWTKEVHEGLKHLSQLFPPTITKKKSAKVLAGTEDMPWSSIDYKKYWENEPDKVGCELGLLEEKTMEKMGWTRHHSNAGGYWYENGIQKIVFYKDEKVTYWSNYGMSPTQSWNEVEMPIRWLWKNKKSSGKTNEVPYSGTDYKEWNAKYWPDTPSTASISLKPEDTATMEKMGFVKEVDNEVSEKFRFLYKNQHGTDSAHFFADGSAEYWKTPADGGYYYVNAKELMQMLWDKYHSSV